MQQRSRISGTVYAVATALLLSMAIGAGARADTYSVHGGHIYKNGKVWCGAGADSFDQFGPGAVSGHGLVIVREVVQNLSACVLGHGAQSWNGFTLHGLQDVVDANRAHGLITILCPFTWARPEAITGDDPSARSFFTDGEYAARLAAVAKQFKAQPDVWIDPWNEPNFSSETDWRTCVTTMYDAIRGAGNDNIVLIPCNKWDSDESDYLDSADWLRGKTNAVATIHIYNGWDAQSAADIESRLQKIMRSGWAVVVGEIGGDGTVRDPIRGLEATADAHVPTLAWSWDSSDGDQLQNSGTPTKWGDEFFSFVDRYRPGGSGNAVATAGP